MAFGMNFVTYWFSDKIVLKMYGAQPVTEAEAPELSRMIEKLAQRASLPMPWLYVINGDQPNAFATGRNPEHGVVVVTKGIMQILSRDELEAYWHMNWRTSNTGISSFIQMAISRSREYAADAGGARIAGNPMYLANALHKLHMASQRIPMNANPATAHMFIVNPLSGRGLMRLFSTHPPMEERIARLESMRPEA